MAKATKKVDYAEIAVPVQVEIPKQQFGYRFELKIGSEDGETLRQITQGLHDSGKRLRNGSKVISASQAVVWVLQQLGDEIASFD